MPLTPVTSSGDAHRLLDVDELSIFLGRRPSTIRKDLRRKPEAVPPRLLLPGTRLLRWRVGDVVRWMEQHVEGVCK